MDDRTRWTCVFFHIGIGSPNSATLPPRVNICSGEREREGSRKRGSAFIVSFLKNYHSRRLQRDNSTPLVSASQLNIGRGGGTTYVTDPAHFRTPLDSLGTVHTALVTAHPGRIEPTIVAHRASWLRLNWRGSCKFVQKRLTWSNKRA